MITPEILNERQVQEVYGFSIPYLRRARRERRGPKFLKLGKLVRYRKADLEAFISSGAVETRNVHDQPRKSRNRTGE